MRLESLVDEYLDHLRVEKGLAAATLSAYGRDLSGFVRAAESMGVIGLQDLSPAVVLGWQSHLAASGLSARSAARHLSALRGFTRYLSKEGYSSENQTQSVQSPRPGRRLPRAMATADVLLMLEQPDPKTARGLRDRAMLGLAYGAGLRASEVVQLQRGDVDLTRGLVMPVGKGTKRRYVPLADVCVHWLREHLDRCGEGALVFESPRGGALTRQAFWKIVRTYARAAGIAGSVHPHRLRHSFATDLLAGGADLRSVQALLGHADVSTTEVYTHVSQVHLAARHRDSHPRGRRTRSKPREGAKESTGG
jgi:integrase/recombinase XerD